MEKWEKEALENIKEELENMSDIHKQITVDRKSLEILVSIIQRMKD